MLGPAISIRAASILHCRQIARFKKTLICWPDSQTFGVDVCQSLVLGRFITLGGALIALNVTSQPVSSALRVWGDRHTVKTIPAMGETESRGQKHNGK